MSPSRSPSGPTYTQLSGNGRSSYHTSGQAQQTGMWAWQGGPTASGGPTGSSNEAGQGSAPGGSGSATHPPQGGPGPNGQQPPGQQHELSDMLQMLDQGGSTTFEDLNMFNTTFE